MLSDRPRKVAPRPAQSSKDSSDESNSDLIEKDETELELEKLVFGNEQGFHDDLQSYNKNSQPQYSSTADVLQEDGSREVEDAGFEGLEDSAVRTVDLLLVHSV